MSRQDVHEFALLEDFGTTLVVAHLLDQDDLVSTGTFDRLSLIFSDLDPATTKVTAYLYGTPEPGSTHGSAPSETYRKYTHTEEFDIEIDATTPTHGVCHIDLRGVAYTVLEEYGHVSEMHIKLDAAGADTANVVGYLSVTPSTY